MDIFEKFIALKTADKSSFEQCVDCVELDLSVEGVKSNLHFHHLRFDGNDQPMIKGLAETLYLNIIDYCMSAREREEPLTNQQFAKLIKECREMFRKPTVTDDTPDLTGEAGEALLYFLTETVLNAPQMVAINLRII